MKEQKIKITAAVITVLFFFSLIFVGVTMKRNTSLKGEMNSEKLKTENLLAEKLKLDKQLIELKGDLNGLTGKNAELNKYVADMQSQLSEKEESIKKLGNENGSLKRFRKEAEDLRKMREQLQLQVAQLNSKNDQLEAEVLQLNQTLVGLQQQNQGLSSQITEMLAFTGANFKVEVVRRNQQKLTHKARRTHTLLITFDLPKKDGKRNFRVDLQSPTGSNLNGDLKVESIDSTGDLTASTEGAPSSAKETITLAFTPEARLGGGTYSILIFDGHKYINNLQFRLSK